MSRSLSLSLAAIAGLSLASVAAAQVGYGVNSSGSLFSFSLSNPTGPVNTIGNLGFVPEGIDFRPGTNDLYAIDVGSATTRLYRINVTTGAATPVGAGFATQGTVGAAGYNLSGSQTFGFDFNPTTLQADTSMRIRLVSSNGTNLRLNDTTGGVAAVDGALAYASGGQTPAVDAAAYINSAAGTAGGTTALYVMDYTNNQLALQNPPNAGTLNAVGPFGATINSLSNISFDILTDPLSADTGIGGDTGYAVLRRPDAPINGPLGAYLLYNVNLASGQITNGSLVGTGADFTGGFAVAIPSPASAALLSLAGLVTLRRRR